MLRVGLIGAGGIAGAHVGGYLANPGLTTLVAVADPAEENARRRADRAGAAVFPSAERMIAEAQLDAVDICLPHHLHRDAIVTAAEAGLHILCEKPLCLTAAEASDVRAAVEGSGVTLMCAHNQLFAPAVTKARELIDEGAVGEVYEVRTTDAFVNDFDPSTMGWRAHASTSGGGELIDTGYHPGYLLLHLARSRPVSVAAMLSTHRLDFMEGEDSAQLLVRFANGVVGSLMTSWAFRPPSNTERFSVVGSVGSLHALHGALHLRRAADQEDEVFAFEPVDEFAAEIRHFAESIAAGTPPLHSHVHGIQVLELILAAYRSAETATIAGVGGD